MITCDKCGERFDELEFDDCPACKADATPFKLKHLKTGEEDKLLLTLRLNPKERELLDDIKLILDISSDGGALKIAAFTGWNVLQRSFGRDNIKWLCDKNRLTRIDK